MRLREALAPLLGSDGLIALLVLTRDGLPVEMFGYGLRAEQLAAEIAGVAGAAARSFRSLGLSEPALHRFTLEGCEVEVVPVEDHYLTLVSDSRQLPAAGRLMPAEALALVGAALKGEG